MFREKQIYREKHREISGLLELKMKMEIEFKCAQGTFWGDRNF